MPFTFEKKLEFCTYGVLNLCTYYKIVDTYIFFRPTTKVNIRLAKKKTIRISY